MVGACSTYCLPSTSHKMLVHGRCRTKCEEHIKFEINEMCTL